MLLSKFLLLISLFFISGCLPVVPAEKSSSERMSLKAFNRSSSLVDESKLNALGCEFELLKKIDLFEFQISPVSDVLRIECEDYKNVNLYMFSEAMNEIASEIAKGDYSKESYAVQVAVKKKLDYLNILKFKMFALDLGGESCFAKSSVTSIMSCSYFEAINLDNYDKNQLNRNILLFRYFSGKNEYFKVEYSNPANINSYKQMSQRYEVFMDQIKEDEDPLEILLKRLRLPRGFSK